MTDTLISRWVAIDDMDIHRVNRSQREVTAYATFFGQATEIRDKHGHYWEEINRSAFNRTLSHGFGRVQVFYNHGYDLSGRPNMLGAVPIGSPTDIKADNRGLLTISRYNDGEVADAVLAAWEGGQIRGQSFSGKVYQDRTKGQREGLDHIERTELGLREFGPTYSPAYEGDGLVMIRSQEDLAELVRAILPSLITPAGTLDASPAGSSTTSATANPAPDAEDENSGQAHFSRNKRRALARRAAMELERTNDHAE
jgi:HK97 family phage prohead protease